MARKMASGKKAAPEQEAAGTEKKQTKQTKPKTEQEPAPAPAKPESPTEKALRETLEQVRETYKEISKRKRWMKPTEEMELTVKLMSDLMDGYERIVKGETFIEDALNGSPYLKAILLIENHEQRIAGEEPMFSNERAIEIAGSMKGQEGEEWRNYLKFFDYYKGYFFNLWDMYTDFKVYAALLVDLTDKWELYRQEAARLTDLYNSLKSGKITGEPLSDEALESFREHILRTHNTENPDILEEGEYTCLWRSTLLFNEEKGAFETDITSSPDGKQSLRQKIEYLKEEAVCDLAATKTYLKIFWDCLFAPKNGGGKRALLLSRNTRYQMITIYGERWVRNLINSPVFLRSVYNGLKSEGYEVNEEDEYKAVMPDFYEVKFDERYTPLCKKELHKALNRREEYESAF